MKVTLMGAGSFPVGGVVCRKGVETNVDEGAFNKLKPKAQAWFEKRKKAAAAPAKKSGNGKPKKGEPKKSDKAPPPPDNQQ